VAADGRKHVLAIGGLRVPESYGLGPSGAPWLLDYAVRLSGAQIPKICLINTAMGDDHDSYLRGYQVLAGLPSQVTHLQLFPMPNTPSPAGLLLGQDVIFVGGGSVANQVAVWRVHGLDVILRQAWEAGVVLSGVSAGALCWFAGGTTDSFGPELRPFTDGLGLLPNSFCPHYDSEARRRPVYHELIGAGALPPGVACDDGAAAHYVDDELAEIVADRAEAKGYLVYPDGVSTTERVLDTRLLTG
jgi:peptidase E